MGFVFWPLYLGMYLQDLLEKGALLFLLMEQQLVDYEMVLFCITSRLLYLVARGPETFLDPLNPIVYSTAYFMRY